MSLRRNKEYWNISLQNPEPLVDEYYIIDNIIIQDENLINAIERLRELIVSYCVIIEKDKNVAEKIIDEIHQILKSSDKIQYTEFIAFWKVLDISFTIFNQSENQKDILSKLLKEYCLRRKRLYDRLGYSNITVQALYDSGASRQKGVSGIKKVLNLASEILSPNEFKHLKTIEEIKNFNIGYFLPDQKDKELFEQFLKEFDINYEFGKNHQGKYPDIVLKINNHFFITEAKHIKEAGGAQNKQITETIEFIKYSEENEIVHYLSFMDGIYFNNFIRVQNDESKISQQKKDIEKYLDENPRNFFVNTAGLRALLQDLLK